MKLQQIVHELRQLGFGLINHPAMSRNDVIDADGNVVFSGLYGHIEKFLNTKKAEKDREEKNNLESIARVSRVNTYASAVAAIANLDLDSVLIQKHGFAVITEGEYFFFPADQKQNFVDALVNVRETQGE